MTATIEDTDISVLESLSPPCEYPYQPGEDGMFWVPGRCPEPAKWIVHWKPIMPCCGHPKGTTVTLFADACWQRLLVTGGLCFYCRAVAPTQSVTRLVEAL